MNEIHRKSLGRSWRSASPVTKLTVLFAGVTAGATVLYCLFAGWQLYEIHSNAADTRILAEAAKKQADKTETISASASRIASTLQNAMDRNSAQGRAYLDAYLTATKLEERAWVVVTNIASTEAKVGKPLDFTVSLTNTGKTPALGVNCVDFVEVVGRGHKPTFDISSVHPEIPNSQGILAPNGEARCNVVSPTRNNPGQVLGETGLQSIRSGAVLLYIHGKVWYRDVYQTPHHTVFCYSMRPNDDVFDVCPEHNQTE